MNNRLVKVCEDILNDENEFKKFFGIKTLGEIYDYLKNKVPDLSSDEFGYFVAKVLEEYEKQKGNSNVIDLKKLEKIAGGKGFGKRLASGGLALASLLTSQPSLYAAKAGKTEQHTDSYLSGKDLGDKDSTDRSERSGGNSSSALGYVATLLGGAVVGAVAAAGVAYKNWPSKDDFDLDKLLNNVSTSLSDRVVDKEFIKCAAKGDKTCLNDLSCHQFARADHNPSVISEYELGLAVALYYGKYDFFDEFISAFNRDSYSGGKVGNEWFYYYMLRYVCTYSDKFLSVACMHLLNRYGGSINSYINRGYLQDSECYRHKLDSETIAKDIAAPLISRGQWDLLKKICETGLVDPLYCLKYVKDASSVEYTIPRFVSEFLRDRRINNEQKLHEALMQAINNDDLDSLQLYLILNPEILNWGFSFNGERCDSNGVHLFAYLCYKGRFKLAEVLTDDGVMERWYYTEVCGATFFEWFRACINHMMGQGGTYWFSDDVTDVNTAKNWYCKLWDKAVAQGAGAQLDQNLSPEKLGYRLAPALSPYGGGGGSLQ